MNTQGNVDIDSQKQDSESEPNDDQNLQLAATNMEMCRMEEDQDYEPGDEAEDEEDDEGNVVDSNQDEEQEMAQFERSKDEGDETE